VFDASHCDINFRIPISLLTLGGLTLPADPNTAPITVRAAKTMVSEIDALAAAMDRSRNYIVNQALQQYLEANTWQIERIKEGLAAAQDGRVRPAEAVFADIAAKHGWST
jgi:predicted transcriptional regulator